MQTNGSDPAFAADSSTLLLIDAGNSRTKIGLFDAIPPATGELPLCRMSRVFDNGVPAPPWEELRRAAPVGSVMRICITGSNPPRAAELTQSLPADWPAPLALPPRTAFPLQIDLDFPERAGIDRLLGALAANQIRRPGQAAIVVSSGTAATVDYVAPDGRFCGGAILPGFELSAKALHEYTALLPLIPLQPVLSAPPEDLGRNTEAALRSGLYWGHVGAVRELVHRLMHRAAADERRPVGEVAEPPGDLMAVDTPLLLLTGGAAPLLTPHMPSFCRHEPHLPLQGLALLVLSMQPAAR